MHIELLQIYEKVKISNPIVWKSASKRHLTKEGILMIIDLWKSTQLHESLEICNLKPQDTTTQPQESLKLCSLISIKTGTNGTYTVLLGV